MYTFTTALYGMVLSCTILRNQHFMLCVASCTYHARLVMSMSTYWLCIVCAVKVLFMLAGQTFQVCLPFFNFQV